MRKYVDDDQVIKNVERFFFYVYQGEINEAYGMTPTYQGFEIP